MSIYENLSPLDLKSVKTYSLDSRPSKVSTDDFAAPIKDDSTLVQFLDGLPRILAVESLRNLSIQIRRARDLGKPVIWGIGGHVIKTGLTPLLIDLMHRGYVSAFAANGSVLVHDAEIAMVGSTSEDVDSTLGEGAFGAAEETGQVLNSAAALGAGSGIGLGESLGKLLIANNSPNQQLSLLCEAYKRAIPFTAHVAVGTDIAHFHPSVNGAAIGESTHTDFRLFSELVKRLNGGGVYLNIGSAVILPEVFLKAVTLVRNLGFPLQDFTTASFDFIQGYRPLTNVVRRPTANGAGRGFALTGHHEIMVPLLAAMLVSE